VPIDVARVLSRAYYTPEFVRRFIASGEPLYVAEYPHAMLHDYQLREMAQESEHFEPSKRD